MAVKHWMTNDVITVKADTSLLKCRNLMKEKNIRRVPVVDDDNHVIGIISDRDVKSASPSKATALEVHEMQYLLAEIKARDIMTPSPVTVKPDATVENAAVLMVDRKIGGLPVVGDDGKLWISDPVFENECVEFSKASAQYKIFSGIALLVEN